MINSSDPLYMQIYNQLRDDIHARKYSASERLPTEKELCQMYHVSRITSKKALNMLVEDNLVVRIKGKGTYISHSQSHKTSVPVEKYKQLTIGVIMSEFDNSYGRDILVAIEDSCRKNDILCIFHRSCGDQHTEEKALDDMIRFGVSGVIILPVHGTYYNAKILRLVLDGFPIVLVDRDLRGIPSHFVGTDNVAAAEIAMDDLIEKGHKKIGVFSPEYRKTSSLEDRMEGIHCSLQKNNVNLDPSLFLTDLYCTLPICSHSNAFTVDRAAITEHILANKDMTAAFAMEYNIALIIKSVVEELGMKVPEDISIMCFDSPELMLPGKYDFAHMRQSQGEMGLTAFELLFSLINGDVKENTIKISLAANLTPGDSVKERS